jgi:hypothetical protein
MRQVIERARQNLKVREREREMRMTRIGQEEEGSYALWL